MQEAGYKAGLIALSAGAFALFMRGANAAPPDLPLREVSKLVRSAGIKYAWSVMQVHSRRSPWIREIEVYSERGDIGDDLCGSRLTDLELAGKSGRITVRHVRRSMVYSFFPCQFSEPGNFHHVGGTFDSARLRLLAQDVDMILHLTGDPHSSKVKTHYDEERLRHAVDVLEPGDVESVSARPDGSTAACFTSKALHLETLAADVIHAKGQLPEVHVGICADVDPARRRP